MLIYTAAFDHAPHPTHTQRHTPEENVKTDHQAKPKHTPSDHHLTSSSVASFGNIQILL